MQLIIHKIKKIIFLFFIILIIVNCKKKNELENQITIKINSIDKKTKQHRINMYDTIVVRKEGFGYLKKNFNKVGEYVTDSMGSIKIKIDTTKIYDISISGFNVLGGNFYYPGELKNNQEVSIEVFPIYKK